MSRWKTWSGTTSRAIGGLTHRPEPRDVTESTTTREIGGSRDGGPYGPNGPSPLYAAGLDEYRMVTPGSWGVGSAGWFTCSSRNSCWRPVSPPRGSSDSVVWPTRRPAPARPRRVRERRRRGDPTGSPGSRGQRGSHGSGDVRHGRVCATACSPSSPTTAVCNTKRASHRRLILHRRPTGPRCDASSHARPPARARHLRPAVLPATGAGTGGLVIAAFLVGSGSVVSLAQPA